MNEAEATSREPFSLRDALILVASSAACLGRLRADPWWNRFDLEGTALWAAWYALAAPTIAGPLLVPLHRQGRTAWKPLSGRTIWVVFGTSIVLEMITWTALTYLPEGAFFLPPIASISGLLGPFAVGLLFSLNMLLNLTIFAVFPAFALVGIAYRGYEGRPATRTGSSWLDFIGRVLGASWAVRSGWMVAHVLNHPELFWP